MAEFASSTVKKDNLLIDSIVSNANNPATFRINPYTLESKNNYDVICSQTNSIHLHEKKWR